MTSDGPTIAPGVAKDFDARAAEQIDRHFEAWRNVDLPRVARIHALGQAVQFASGQVVLRSTDGLRPEAVTEVLEAARRFEAYIVGDGTPAFPTVADGPADRCTSAAGPDDDRMCIFAKGHHGNHGSPPTVADGPADRCTSTVGPDGSLRCVLTEGHGGNHSVPDGAGDWTVWGAPTVAEAYLKGRADERQDREDEDASRH